MKFIGIIPARFASTRFPGKPLADIGGKTMIQRVVEQSKKSTLLDSVVVATDDERIAENVKSFGGDVVMTSADAKSGTDRSFEVIKQMGFDGNDVVINIQGDEPFIQAAQIDLLCSCFKNAATNIATLVKKIESADELDNPGLPKVIFDKNNDAVYFSRTPIPFLRDIKKEDWLKHHVYYKHIGMYAYRTATLSEITKLPQSSLELAESLEQLRWIENGYTIHVEITDMESLAIDTPEDLQKALKKL